MRRAIARIGKSLSSSVKGYAYAPALRNAARKVLTSERADPIRTAMEKRGLAGHINRYTSETLPTGQFFAKLTINDWERFNGQSFRLRQGDRVVYGNEIEPPAKGFPLEYRNFVVTSSNKADFQLDIDSGYTLQIGHGTFSTPQQREYDKKYGVRQHGNVFYSLRGNTTSPSKVIVTFPGFGPSTSRISYAVSYLKDLTDSELADTLMICFQDRYLAAGSYMLVDSAGRSVIDEVNAVIDGYMQKHDIDDSQMLMFGASKGGSIAVQYADRFPKAQLLLAVPQMHLRYYLNKPFFRDNLFKQDGLHDVPQPETLLRKYFSEGRTVHYFYTLEDEQSNFSLIETIADVENLTKYRFDGKHGDVARKALPTMMGIIRRFLRDKDDSHKLPVLSDRIFLGEHSVGYQARIDDEQATHLPANWYLQGRLGRTRFMQNLTDHHYPFIKYTNDKQRLSPDIDYLAAIDSIVALDRDGRKWEGDVSGFNELPTDSPGYIATAVPKLQVETSGPHEHTIVSHDKVASIHYVSRRGLGSDDCIEVHIVEDLNYFDLNGACRETTARFVAAVETTQVDELVELFVSRLHIVSACESVAIRYDPSYSELLSSGLFTSSSQFDDSDASLSSTRH
ncbi:hypothetical protein SAMN04489752_3613 [Brevibacterium siliguriense]|uniref:Accessory Sec system protein Asp2 n=1 Tax=Brevibacterium siliguriense TaxID=1136497 RepID=A0A1H1YAZ0_9MICO|nr:hypothetical protein [Brevibacterium siliguriense]SDT18562.1 hypothetical protein SAMN04489752_3613 [Brevibacterium siliguriense]